MPIEKQIWIAMLMEGFLSRPYIPDPFGGHDGDGGVQQNQPGRSGCRSGCIDRQYGIPGTDRITY